MAQVMQNGDIIQPEQNDETVHWLDELSPPQNRTLQQILASGYPLSQRARTAPRSGNVEGLIYPGASSRVFDYFTPPTSGRQVLFFPGSSREPQTNAQEWVYRSSSHSTESGEAAPRQARSQHTPEGMRSWDYHRRLIQEAKLESVASTVFRATQSMMSDLDKALVDPGAVDQHLYHAATTAKKTLDRLAETGDRDSVVGALGEKAVENPQQEMVALAVDAFLGAEIRILALGQVPADVQKRALQDCFDLWQMIEESESLTARDFMDRVRRLREATNRYAKSLDWQPAVEFADGIPGAAARLLFFTTGTVLFTVNLAALGPAAPFVTAAAQSLGKELFMEAVPDDLKPAARMASFFGEVLMSLGDLADAVSFMTDGTELPGGPEQRK